MTCNVSFETEVCRFIQNILLYIPEKYRLGFYINVKAKLNVKVIFKEKRVFYYRGVKQTSSNYETSSFKKSNSFWDLKAARYPSGSMLHSASASLKFTLFNPKQVPLYNLKLFGQYIAISENRKAQTME